jgi:hypothetical protein
LLVLGGALLAAGMVVAAILLTRGDGRPASTTATQAEAPTPVPTLPPRKHAKHTRKPAAPAPVPEAPTLTSYFATYYTVDRPGEWTTEHDDEEQPGGFLRAQWRDPADSETSVLIDAQEEDLSAQEKADDVRSAVARTGGFRDLGMSDTTMNGLPAVKWEFEVSGDHRVDYFVHNDECGLSAAVLGSTHPSTWEARRDTFSEIADSLALDCTEVKGASLGGPGSECDPSYEGECLDPTMPDYDCDGGSGDGPGYTGEVEVVGDDHYELDRDGDGIACDQ